MTRKWYYCFLILIWILSFHDALVAEKNSSARDLFPLPQVLKPNVEFWMDIYSKYSEREIVIHDAEDLGIVYEVVQLDSLFKGIQVSERLQWKRIERIKRDYQALLARLSRKRDLRLDALTGKEKYIASLFGENLNRARLRRASRNVRAQNGLKERFREGLERSGLYISQMREIFTALGLPEELLALPHVESSFNYKAYSKFGAAGVWQFTRSTGRLYLKINYQIDERLDPIRATEAAAMLLKHNYEELGSWPLAINAYNHGLHGMKRARKRYGHDIGKIVKYYNSRSFGFASRNFYSEFLAALRISTNYKKYFGEVEFQKPGVYLVLETPDYISVQTLLDNLDVSIEEFARFNPALRTPVLRSKRRIPKNTKIRIPWNESLNVQELYAKISPRLKFSEQVQPDFHIVQRGETLSFIARKYSIPMYDILASNDITNAHRIYVGQKLNIPQKGNKVVTPPRIVKKTEEAVMIADASALGNKEEVLLDAPSSLSLDLDLKAPEKEKMAVEKRMVPKAVNDLSIDYLPVKNGFRNKASQARAKGLSPVYVQQIENRFASMEDEMAMALPEFTVEMTKSMGTRIVRTARVDNLNQPSIEIDWPENGQVRVEADETLGHFADWLGVSTQKLRKINRLSYWEPIRVGSLLWLTFEKVTPEEFQKRRTEYHQGIEEDFYSNYYVEGVKTIKIKRGDNIWLIGHRNFELPYWLIRMYNPDQDLDHLTVGQELVIPIVENRNQTDSFDD
ncbi:MAG: LysM peptidoglycan-binding domain-containing protein [bacterium]